jgi:hypothetical protein
MKSIVASASEFMIATAKSIGVLRKEPLLRIRSINSAKPAMVSCAAARVADVISSETLSCASARRFFRIGRRPVHPV